MDYFKKSDLVHKKTSDKFNKTLKKNGFALVIADSKPLYLALHPSFAENLDFLKYVEDYYVK